MKANRNGKANGNGKVDRRAAREIEQFLRSRHAQLSESVRAIMARRRTAETERTAEPGAFATQTLEDEIQVALADRQSRQVAQIEAALDRLARGEYGQCHDCDGFIGVPRLRALPFAQRCNSCQAGIERTTRRAA
jgi:DnaK suppressor protein